MTLHTLNMEQRLVEGKIQASHTSDFSKFVTVYEMRFGDQSKFTSTNTTEKYRYWRYESPRGSYGNIAELEFYERDSLTPSKGKVIGTLYPYAGDEEWGYEKAFDGDWLTYASTDQASHGWYGIDFKKPVNIEKFRCIPRSDDNGIHSGDEYELLCFTNNGWVSLGRKVGENHVLHFDQVPDDALLLLRNHTRGKEERIFTYENDKQIWW